LVSPIPFAAMLSDLRIFPSLVSFALTLHPPSFLPQVFKHKPPQVPSSHLLTSKLLFPLARNPRSFFRPCFNTPVEFSKVPPPSPPRRAWIKSPDPQLPVIKGCHCDSPNVPSRLPRHALLRAIPSRLTLPGRNLHETHPFPSFIRFSQKHLLYTPAVPAPAGVSFFLHFSPQPPCFRDPVNKFPTPNFRCNTIPLVLLLEYFWKSHPR